jgi:excisionase family DNA binding protein
MPRGRNKQIDWDVPIMNVREVADYLRVSISTIYREAKSGTLPGFKLGSD